MLHANCIYLRIKRLRSVLGLASDEKKVLSEKVYQSVLQLIFTGKLQSGTRIYEEKVTQELGVSRTPVREALLRLSTEGLIKIYPNRYMEVISFNQKDMEDIGVVRINIDTLAALLCVENGRNADFLQLKMIAEECREKSNDEDIVAMIELDSNFHMKLAEISGNSIVEKMQRELYYRVRLLQLKTYSNIADSIKEIDSNFSMKDYLMKRTEGHFNIVDALYKRDQQHIRQCIYEHLSPFYNITKPLDFFI